MKKSQLSKLYDQNFEILMKEAQKCSCWVSRSYTQRGKSNKCSNKEHEKAIKIERRLNALSLKYKNEDEIGEKV